VDECKLLPGLRKSACASAARMRQPPLSVCSGASCIASENPSPVRIRRAVASAQGLTLVHFSAQIKRFVWNRGLRLGLVHGVFVGC